MGLAQIKRTLHEMKLEGMLLGFEQEIVKNQKNKALLMNFLDALLQREQEQREEKQIKRLVSSAKLGKKPMLQDFDETAKRSLEKNEVESLYMLDWVHNQRDILVCGPTGVGKTFLAQALAHHCCLNKIKTMFLDFNQFLEELNMARGSGQYLRYLKKIMRPDVLVLDDFGLRKLAAAEANDFCDVIKSRLDKCTLYTTQLPMDHWFEVIGDPVVADTIIDRLLHTSIKVDLKGESYRKVEGKKLDQLPKGKVATSSIGRR